MMFTSLTFAQINPIDFEPEGNGADWTWEVFENADNPPVEIIDNPDPTGANTSATVAQFTAKADGASFAGTISDGIGSYLLDETNRTITITVWKSVISDVGIKLETESGFSPGEIKVANTATGEWEEITFDFSSYANPPEGEQYTGITVFPDFQERDQDNTVYFDNIVFSEGSGDGGNGDDGDNGDGDGDLAGPRNPIDFENDGFGADWTWSVFENADNPALEIIDNPDMNGNTSSKVAQFTARADGQPFAGVESAHGDTDLGPFVLDETNSTITIMVWKPTISDVGVKLVAESGWSQPEVKVSNTVVNEWEELTFDFSEFPNPPAEEGPYDQIVVFPDFVDGDRTQDNIVYFDNITFSGEGDGGDNGDIPAGNLLTNGDFESGDDGSWYGNALDIRTEGDNSFNFADVETAGNAFDVNISQDVDLMPGQSYLLSFEASTGAGDTRDMVVGIGESQGPFRASTETVTLTETTQTYRVDLVATDDDTGEDFGDATSRVLFDMGADVGIVVIDNVSLEATTIEAFSLVSPPDETSLSLTGDGTSEAVIEWSEAVSSGDVTYVWHADVPGSDFSDPLVSIPSDDNGQATSLTLTFAALDQALADLGVAEGESIDLEWTVTASDESSVRFADEVFAITLSRELDVSNEVKESPRSFALNQNYPNPFNPTTSISYTIPESGDVKLEVFNAVGQKVATLVNSTQNAGTHTVSFDASNLASGVYLYRLTSANQVQINKMLLLK